MAMIKLRLVSVTPVTVTTAGTRVPLSGTSLKVSYLLIQKHESNTGVIYIGDSTVASSNGIVIGSSLPSLVMSADDTEADEDKAYFDLSEIYIDASVNGDKVRIAYIEQASTTY